MTEGSFPLAIFAAMSGILLLAGHAAAQCTPVAAQARQPGESVLCLCRIGPVTAGVPACEIKTGSLDEQREDYVSWKNEKGIWHHIVVITPKHPRRFRGYLNRWRHNHKCTAEERIIGNPSRFEGPAGLGDIPPQVTWTGCCAAGDCYAARAIAAGNQVVELHVDAGLGYRLEAAAGQDISALINRVRLSRPPSR